MTRSKSVFSRLFMAITAIACMHMVHAEGRISMAEHAMALGADGLLWTWGDNDYSQVDPDSADDVVATPTLICPETNTGSACTAFRASTGTVQRLVASNDYSLMLKGGRVWSWGDNGWGYLGDGTEIDRPHPVPVCRADAQTIPCGTDEQLTGIVDIDAKAATLAITDAGKLLSWGYGPLGRATGSVPYTLPGEVCPDDDVASDCAGFRAAGAAIDVALTWDVALTVKADGTVWAWGSQYYGLIGDDQQIADNILRPSRVCVNGGGQCVAFEAVPVRAIAAKGNYALALREDDTIWGWGDNFYGQIGDGTTGTMRLTPVQVCPDSDLTDDCNAFRGAVQDSGIRQITAGYVHSMALTGDGRVWAWGDNFHGQMGDGMIDDRPRPHEVCPVSDVSDECVAFRAAGPVQEISGRYDSNAALTEDGRLWTWGANYPGTLGHGTYGPDSEARLPQPVIGYDAIGGGLDLELHRPTNQTPTDGANAANPVLLDTAAYRHDAPTAPAHAGTQWQVSKSSGFSTLVLDTTFVNAAQMFSPASLDDQSLGELTVGETYWWRARHRTENGDWSYWSTPTSFTVLDSPGASLSSTSLDFGSVAVGANSATQSVTLTNDGGSALNLTGVNIYGDYAIVSNACAPFPRVLNASQQCAIELRFSPTATGTRDGLLSIASDHPASPHAVTLTGNGTAVAPTPAPALSLSPTDHDFGSVAVGATSDAQAITLTNTGTATLSGITLQLLGDYQQVSTTCGATLAASGSCTVDVRFAPTGTGARPGGLVVSSDAAESPHVAYFQGAGTAAGSVPAPAVSLTPSTLTFVAQTVGTVSAAQTVTLRNDGTAPLTSIDVEVYGMFSVESNCTAPLAVSGECSLQVRATPQFAGSFTGLIAVTTDAAGSPHLVGLSGSGTAASGAPAPVLTFSPTSLSFGSVNLGSESAVATVTLGNGGNAALSNLVLEVLGDYVIASNDCGSSLAAGAGCSVGIRFRPQAAGTRIGGLVIRSNAAGSPQVVGLSGNGVQASQTPDGGSNDGAGGDSDSGSGGGDDGTSGGGLSMSGGCTLAGGDAATDPTLPLLVLAGLVAIRRGRRGVGQSAIR